MIADLVDDKLKVRLITHNVMSIYSTRADYMDTFLRKLKHSRYLINGEYKQSDNVIGYTKRNYNRYKNIFRFITKNKDINSEKFISYITYLDLNYLLWLSFYQLTVEQLLIIELLIQLAGNKRIIILDCIDSLFCKKKLYSLLFHIGLEDKLLIVPFTNISDAVNNSTCQCYVKSLSEVKIQSCFSNTYLNNELGTSIGYYTGVHPIKYKVGKKSDILAPISYKYSLYELLLIFLFSIKMLNTYFFNWRMRV